jgi:catechol 2,3-dioxygenase-like lactoylglutathione lyase family enzyme
MTQHHAIPILPCNDIETTQAFYERLGFEVVGGDTGFRILTDLAGWQIALRPAEQGWVIPNRNSHGIYLYCEDVDAVANRVREHNC